MSVQLSDSSDPAHGTEEIPAPEIAENPLVQRISAAVTTVAGQIRRRLHTTVEETTTGVRRFFGRSESQVAASLAPLERTLALEIETYETDRRHFLIGLQILNVLALSTLSIICYLLVKYLDGFSLQPDRAELSDFNLHLVSTEIGFVIAPVYAILLYRIFPTVKYSRLTAIHVISLTFTSFLAIYGVKISYESHHVYGRVHLYSLHGWLGVTLTVLLFFCIVSGNWIYLSPTQLPFMVKCHKIIGMTLITVATGASISGILTRSQHLLRRLRLSTDPHRGLPDRVLILNSLGIIITVFVFLARWLLTEDRFKRRPRPGRIVDEEAVVTGLLRYLATADDSVVLPDEERAWTEFVDDEEEEDVERFSMPSHPLHQVSSVLSSISAMALRTVNPHPDPPPDPHPLPAVLNTIYALNREKPSGPS